MFTGLIEGVGTVLSLRRRSTGTHLSIRTDLIGITRGESIAVNGVCQTVVETGKGSFSCDVLSETLRITNVGHLRPGSLVNLERALRQGDRLGGHIVNGHVDGMGTVTSVSMSPLRIEISVAPQLFKYLVPKGSVAVDGISLTIGPQLARGHFEVFIVPHSWENTNLSNTRVGRKVNIEIDILAKYIYNFLRRGRGEGT